jgi:hypothetical protein
MQKFNKKLAHAMLNACLAGGLLFASAATYAAGKITSVNGNVTVSIGGGAPLPVAADSFVAQGNEVASGANSRAVMRMDDGQVFAVGANSRFKIDTYRYRSNAPQEGGATLLAFLQGSLRVVSGLIASKSPQNFAVRTATATIGVRGTDFMLSLGADGQLYFQVLDGAIEVTTSAGTVSFSSGAIGVAASGQILAAPIAAGALPVTSAVSFSQLVSIAPELVSSVIQSAGATGGVVPGVVPGGIASGVGASVGAVALAIPLPVLIGIGAVIVGAAARGNSSSTTTHGNR